MGRYCPVLKAALKQGCRITKVHKMLVYGKRAYMASYVATLGRIKREQDELKAAGKPYNPALRQAAKDMLNCLYGKTLSRVRETEVRLVPKAEAPAAPEPQPALRA